jgi:hypothetical protein
VIAKAEGTKSVIFSTSAAAPTLPTGYTYKAYTGAWYNGADGHFRGAYQKGNHVSWGAFYTAVSLGTTTSYTGISVDVPTTARIWHGHMAAYASNGMACVSVASDASGLGADVLVGYDTSDGTAVQTNAYCLIKTAQTIYYKIHTTGYGTSQCNVYTGAWEY